MRRFYYPNKRTSWLYFISYLALQTSFQFLRRSVNIPFSPRIISVSNNLLIRENVRITINKSANLVKQGKQKQDLFLFQVSNSPSMTTCWHKYFFLFLLRNSFSMKEVEKVVSSAYVHRMPITHQSSSSMGRKRRQNSSQGMFPIVSMRFNLDNVLALPKPELSRLRASHHFIRRDQHWHHSRVILIDNKAKIF